VERVSAIHPKRQLVYATDATVHVLGHIGKFGCNNLREVGHPVDCYLCKKMLDATDGEACDCC